MFKMILSAVVTLGLGSVAYAADPAAGAAETPKTEAPAGTEMPAAEHMKKEHGKKMAHDDMKKEKHHKKEKKAEGGEH